MRHNPGLIAATAPTRMRYSLLNILRNGFTGNRHWQPAWRFPEPKKSYDVIIIGGGGHGLATAYYLAKLQGVRNVAVLERGAIGLGNTGRNTTIVRSNYYLDESAALYEHSLNLWERLAGELNFNLMFSQRGVVSLASTRHELSEMERRAAALKLNGIDSEMLSLADLKRWVPILNLSRDIRYPVLGGMVQRRGGNARHDAVAWGYARAADALGVDIIQQCAVNEIRVANGRVAGVDTARGCIAADKVAIAAAGRTTLIAETAGVPLPIQSYALQAMVSEPVKPVLGTVVMSGLVHCYVSQSNKGELVFGAARDGYISYAQRGSFHISEETIGALLELFPIFSRLRLLRQWAGIVDVTPDLSPIIGLTPVAGLYVNCGWGTGGFKATPGSGWVFAHTIAHDTPHPLNAAFGLDRFVTGRLIDESAAAGVSQ